MNILFLTTGTMQSIEQHAIYPDLLRYFKNQGHNVYCVSSYEKRTGKITQLINENGALMLHVKIGNLTKTNLVEKGISTVLIENQYKNAIKKYFSGVIFDLVLYSTPPITLVNVIKYIKKRDNCKTYLLLKDIFPQNAIDLGMLYKKGIKGIIYKYFRNKEKALYQISDYIGCMSVANVKYIKNNNDLDLNKLEVCPNSIEPVDMSVDENIRIEIRKKYSIPLDKTVFVYGGNLGKPQGIEFMIKCLKSQSNNKHIYFLIVGDGTEFSNIENFVTEYKPSNVKLMKRLPKEDYDTMVGACDVGMIFLDNRFTIPNYPSRLLSYMQAKIPVLAVTDSNSDIGETIINGEFGWWSQSDKVESFEKNINQVLESDIKVKGNRAYEYLLKNFTVEIAYNIIINHLK